MLVASFVTSHSYRRLLLLFCPFSVESVDMMPDSDSGLYGIPSDLLFLSYPCTSMHFLETAIRSFGLSYSHL